MTVRNYADDKILIDRAVSDYEYTVHKRDHCILNISDPETEETYKKAYNIVLEKKKMDLKHLVSDFWDSLGNDLTTLQMNISDPWWCSGVADENLPLEKTMSLRDFFKIFDKYFYEFIGKQCSITNLIRERKNCSGVYEDAYTTLIKLNCKDLMSVWYTLGNLKLFLENELEF